MSTNLVCHFFAFCVPLVSPPLPLRVLQTPSLLISLTPSVLQSHMLRCGMMSQLSFHDPKTIETRLTPHELLFDGILLCLNLGLLGTVDIGEGVGRYTPPAFLSPPPIFLSQVPYSMVVWPVRSTRRRGNRLLILPIIPVLSNILILNPFPLPFPNLSVH